jgi:hypothetical protein
MSAWSKLAHISSITISPQENAGVKPTSSSLLKNQEIEGFLSSRGWLFERGVMDLRAIFVT